MVGAAALGFDHFRVVTIGTQSLGKALLLDKRRHLVRHIADDEDAPPRIENAGVRMVLSRLMRVGGAGYFDLTVG